MAAGARCHKGQIRTGLEADLQSERLFVKTDRTRQVPHVEVQVIEPFSSDRFDISRHGTPLHVRQAEAGAVSACNRPSATDSRFEAPPRSHPAIVRIASAAPTTACPA